MVAVSFKFITELTEGTKDGSVFQSEFEAKEGMLIGAEDGNSVQDELLISRIRQAVIDGKCTAISCTFGELGYFGTI